VIGAVFVAGPEEKEIRIAFEDVAGHLGGYVAARGNEIYPPARFGVDRICHIRIFGERGRAIPAEWS